MSEYIRPPGYVSGVIIPPRIAYILETNIRLTTFRSQSRGNDQELDAALNAIRWAAMQWAASVNGSQHGEATEAPTRLRNWYTPAQIATKTGITEHAVRLAIREGRLPAEKVDRMWTVSPADYSNFITARRNL
ncbi:helix-turn-helix domain-containing protein [Cryobacterium sp. HLT2-28]|uniref:helix-turn-helix domain-containing protein n=1 Tax=Cryobacterium sp. HLT2-28 TaxID=1259146 RepID=UPI00106C4A78|nr:helix-turn-helix domain-containing protein [Cryobacterium sp. HLT2-28]TFB92777.1 DNA-binding protein [Cryobacterium sp. HLT2-28]